jgi:hypothetical protein
MRKENFDPLKKITSKKLKHIFHQTKHICEKFIVKFGKT